MSGEAPGAVGGGADPSWGDRQPAAAARVTALGHRPGKPLPRSVQTPPSGPERQRPHEGSAARSQAGPIGRAGAVSASKFRLRPARTTSVSKLCQQTRAFFFFFWEFCVGSAQADRGTPGARGRSRGTRAWRDGSGTYIFPFYPSRASVRSQDLGRRPRQPHP